MARQRSQYVCQQCGGVHPKWSGQCDHCGGWNSLVEEREEKAPGPAGRSKGKAVELESLKSSGQTCRVSNPLSPNLTAFLLVYWCLDRKH